MERLGVMRHALSVFGWLAIVLAALSLGLGALGDESSLYDPMYSSVADFLIAGLVGLQLLFMGLMLLVFSRILELLGAIRTAVETKPIAPAGQ
jgi:hypothetical protein